MKPLQADASCILRDTSQFRCICKTPEIYGMIMLLLFLQGKARRHFVQTFFLAVQEKGYFVLNDIFRYLPPATQSPRIASSPAPLENGYALASSTQQQVVYRLLRILPFHLASSFASLHKLEVAF